MSDNSGEKLNRLIIAVAHGSADSLDGIYEIAGKRMLAVARSLAGDYAEDVLHDSFIKIAKFAHKYKYGTSPYGWLMKIVRNTALDFLRARKAHPTVNCDELFNLTSFDYSPEKRENAIMLEQAVNQLEHDEKIVIYYKYYLDMTVREIAEELKQSKSAVQRTADRAEKKLKIILESGTKF